MHLQDLLKKEQIKIDFSKSFEYKYIKENSLKYKNILTLYNIKKNSRYGLILNSIILRSLVNKTIIEQETSKYLSLSIKEKNYVDKLFISEKIKSCIKDNNLPYMTIEDKFIYVPIFSYSVNNIYSLEQYKIFDRPNDDLLTKYKSFLIDLFEQYNFTLFDSSFTRLIKISEKNNCAAFYHEEFKTVFFINSQGRLDYELCLFDKHLENPNFNNVKDRLSEVCEAYFTNNKNNFIEALLSNKLISDKVIKIYNKKNRV